MVKKSVKMHLSEFQADEAFGPSLGGGSWADDDTQEIFANLPPASGRPPRSGGMNDDRTAGDWRRGGPPPQFRDNDREDFIPREPVPIPDAPPYTARLINLDYNATEAEINGLFASDDFHIESVRLPKDAATQKIRGYAFVQFEDRASLEKALTLTGTSLLNRPVRIFVAEKRQEEAFEGDWRANRSGPLPPRPEDDNRDYDKWERRGPISSGGRDGGRDGDQFGRGGRAPLPDDNRDYDNWKRSGPLPARRDFSSGSRFRNTSSSTADTDEDWKANRRTSGGMGEQRKGPRKLNLTPRTVSIESTTSAEAPARSASLFGSARPVDTSKKEQEIGEQQHKILEERHKKREEFQKKKEEKKASEHLRRGFEALSTEDNQEETESQEQKPEDTERSKITAPEAESSTVSEASKEELENGDWETVSGKKRQN